MFVYCLWWLRGWFRVAIWLMAYFNCWILGLWWLFYFGCWGFGLIMFVLCLFVASVVYDFG